MENRLSTRISRMFRGSFGSSCRTRNLSDVVEKAVFLPHQQITNNEENGSVSSLKAPRPFPTICRATCPETASQVINHCTIPSRNRDSYRRRGYPHLVPNVGGSPVSSPLTRSYYQKKQSAQKQGLKNRKKTTRKKKKGATQKRETSSLLSSSSLDSAYFAGSYYWFSSDEEEEEEDREGDKNGYENDDESDALFFSSRSLSSDSSALSASRRRRQPRRRENYANGYSGRKPSGKEIDNSKKAVANTAVVKQRDNKKEMLPLEGKVKGSFAVVKSSSDPYNDFRTSMVEMIIEKQIFGAKDLEQLLQCFLSLNSDHHHRIIVEVFTEIWEALFSDWCS